MNKVHWCAWCPNPCKPDPTFHPGGSHEHTMYLHDAAPDLLAACKKVLDAYNRALTTGGSCLSGRDVDAMALAVQKAEGR